MFVSAFVCLLFAGLVTNDLRLASVCAVGGAVGAWLIDRFTGDE
jgi:hypothetical protein